MLKRFLAYHFSGKNLFFMVFMLALFLLAAFFTINQQRGDGNQWYMAVCVFVFLFHLAASFVSWWKGGGR